MRELLDKLQEVPHLSQVFLNSGDVSALNLNVNKIAIPFPSFCKETLKSLKLDMSKVGLLLPSHSRRLVIICYAALRGKYMSILNTPPRLIHYDSHLALT